MHSEKTTFTASTGDTLTARIARPIGRVRGWSLFAHCFTCSKDLRAVNTISQALANQGVGVFRFDFTGLGESEGDFEDTDFTSNIEDLVAAAAFMEAELQGPSLLVGHSLGGAAVIGAAGHIPSVQAVATVGAPYDPAHVTHLFGDSLETIRETGQARVTLAGRPFTVSRAFVESVEAHRTKATLGELGRPLLVMHSPTDGTVGIDNARLIYDAAKHPKSFISLDGADHLLTRGSDARYVGSILAAWADRYTLEPATEPDVDQLRTRDRVTTRTFGNGFRTDVLAGRHHWVADEPVKVGGDDAGPTPYDLLGAALGTCTGMTLQLYANRKGWPVDEVIVRARYRRVHGEDCAAEGGEPCLDRIDREIEIRGDLTDEQRSRMLEIADRCPVHRTLEAGVVVETGTA